MLRTRLDTFLITKKLATDKKQAFILVTEGRVFVDGQKAISPAQRVFESSIIAVRAAPEYVGRGAYKLKAALQKFNISVKGKICADIGAATGGFTEVLLKCGAKKVYTIDTARGKLALKLRNDPRVVVYEKTDARDVAHLPDPIDIVTIDVSLIALHNILSAVRRMVHHGGSVVALFKPQYETRDQKFLRHGVIRDAAAREKLLHDFMAWAREHDWEIRDWMESPIQGSKGNVEFLLLLKQK